MKKITLNILTLIARFLFFFLIFLFWPIPFLHFIFKKNWVFFNVYLFVLKERDIMHGRSRKRGRVTESQAGSTTSVKNPHVGLELRKLPDRHPR